MNEYWRSVAPIRQHNYSDMSMQNGQCTCDIITTQQSKGVTRRIGQIRRVRLRPGPTPLRHYVISPCFCCVAILITPRSITVDRQTQRRRANHSARWYAHDVNLPRVRQKPREAQCYNQIIITHITTSRITVESTCQPLCMLRLLCCGLFLCAELR